MSMCWFWFFFENNRRARQKMAGASVIEALESELEALQSPDAIFQRMQAVTNAFFDETRADCCVYEGASGLALVSLAFC
jgi:hypothetical protein